MRPLVLLCCSLVAGCNAVLGLEARPLEDETTVEDTTGTVDDTIVAFDDGNDASLDDAVVVETNADDTLVSPDTATTDTTARDTTTTPADTSGDVGSGPVLTGNTEVVGTASVNLTVEGTLDWGHWGHTTASSFNHRATAVLIGKGSVTGSPYAYSMYAKRFSWSDGTPTAAVTNSDAGLALIGAGEGFVVDVAASPSTVRTFRIYTAWNNATGPITATLSDGSAPMLTISAPPAGSTLQYIALNFTFRAATSAARLTVNFKKSGASTGGLSSLSLLAATLR